MLIISHGNNMNKKNPIVYQDNEKTIFNIFSKHGIFECTIDTEDVQKVRDYKWHIHLDFKRKAISQVMACPKHKQKSIFIHNVVTGNVYSDHIDSDVFNNRKSNLRECKNRHNDNQKNMSPHRDAKIPYKGVDEPNRGRFRARIMCDGECMVIGYFDTPEKAALAYNEKAVELHKEFAKLNNI